MEPAEHPRQTWQEIVAIKQQQQKDAIPQEWILSAEVLTNYEQPYAQHQHRFMEADIVRKSGVLSDSEITITSDYSVQSLLDNLKSGKLSSVEVTTAFCKRAAVAQQLTSCLTEIFFEDALKRAKQLDELHAKGELAGPLHGLPISVKDSFKIVGRDATVGYTAYVGDKAIQNSVLIDILLSLGAVLYVKTNIPQTMMTADSENNIFGRTLNPWNSSLTAGGSSGGEGALVALRGSPLGVGTDIAGSVRIPAMCCGTYGFKPTAGRIPYFGQASGVKPGMRYISSCAGPLANDIDALEIFLKSVIDREPAKLDSDVYDLPWRTTTRVSGKSKLRIGRLPTDPHFPLHPPVARAVQEAVQKLKSAGHEIVELDASKCGITEAVEISWHYFSLDMTAMTALSDLSEPIIASIRQISNAFKAMDLSYTSGYADLERLDRVAALNVRRRLIAESWREIWATYDIDAVVGPAAQHTAVPHDRFGLPPYTVLMNLLDYPACVIPYQKARAALDPESMAMNPGQHGPTYEPKEVDGAPCSIQVFTNKLRDEECLAVSRVVDACLKGT